MDNLLESIKTRKKNLAIIGVFLVLALFIAATTYYGTKTLSAVRAYVTAEGQWTEAKSRGIHLLLQYNNTEHPEYYDQAQKQFALHQGFKQARRALTSETLNRELAVQGFQKAGIPPRDIDLLIWLGSSFQYIERLDKAFSIWEEGEHYVSALDSLGGQLHKAIQDREESQESRYQIVTEISELDQTLQVLETSFSRTMGDLTYWIRRLVLWSTIGTGLVLLGGGYWITRRFFREIDDLNNRLSKREAQFRRVLDHSREVIFELDLSSEAPSFNYVSPQFEHQLGYSVDHILDKGKAFMLDQIHPDDRSRVQQDLDKLLEQGGNGAGSQEVDYRIQTKEGDYIWVNAQRSLVTDDEGDSVAIVGNVREITERKEQELQTRHSLRQKKTLLEEIHHRVKNNLSIISSLLELQKDQPVHSVKSLINDTQSRIQSIATIHEKLYKSQSLSKINVQEYIEDFTTMLSNTFHTDEKNITMTKELYTYELEATKAVTLGLIINELLSNAFKHGFRDKKRGEIKITFIKEGEEGVLLVADNGHPLPQSFSLDSKGSLGMTLIKTLTKQLKGELEITQNEWTTFEIRFPLMT